ncbi:MAG: alpha-L-fucosidase [Bacteroidales bacterium]|nr:alpha-L-fucosidase [Bacteroidales bacterium]
MKKFLFTFTFLTSTVCALAQQYQADWQSIDSRPVPEWFENAKFGIFIHWGLYAVPSYSPSAREGVGIYDRYAEHYWRRWLNGGDSKHYFTEFHDRVYGPNKKYQDFANDFKAEMFQPDEWARIFEEAGAKYVVLTSKHHEGFCLWPSQYSWNWNAMDVGPHRDLLGDLTKAVRDKGIKMGYYYSLLEWFNPLYKKETLNQYLDLHMFPQMKELVETYHPDLVWTDGEWDYPSEQLRSVEFLQWLFNESSVKNTVAINDRWGKETRSLHGGFFTTEYDMVHTGDANGIAFTRPWEECRGISGSFGFNRNEYLAEYSTSEELIHMLVNKVARGGNLLLNVGPTADGRIPVIMQQRLKDMGDWLKVNGESIYDTRKWEHSPNFTKESTLYYTSKPDALYVIMTKWSKKPITVKGVKKARKVTMLGYKGKVGFTQSGDQITIKPAVVNSPDDIPCDYAWVYKIQY